MAWSYGVLCGYGASSADACAGCCSDRFALEPHARLHCRNGGYGTTTISPNQVLMFALVKLCWYTLPVSFRRDVMLPFIVPHAPLGPMCGWLITYRYGLRPDTPSVKHSSAMRDVQSESLDLTEAKAVSRKHWTSANRAGNAVMQRTGSDSTAG